MRVEGRCGTAVPGGTHAALLHSSALDRKSIIISGAARSSNQLPFVAVCVRYTHSLVHIHLGLSPHLATYTPYPGPEPMQTLWRSRICRRHPNTEAIKQSCCSTSDKGVCYYCMRTVQLLWHFSRNDWHSWFMGLLSSRTTTSTAVPDILYVVIGASWYFLEVPPFLVEDCAADRLNTDIFVFPSPINCREPSSEFRLCRNLPWPL